MMHKVYIIMKKTLLIVLCLCMLNVAILRVCFGITPQIVVSGSMEPEIMTGSLCFVNKKVKTIEAGDIITFQKGGMLITHRVVGVNADGDYITKGDNNSIADAAPVSIHEVKGKTVCSIPKLGYILAFLSGKTGGI